MVATQPFHWASKAEDLTSDPGAYLLRIDLTRPAVLPPRFDQAVLSPGTYLYAGSAKGPGGIRARCRRHMTPLKKKHWHVDWLTQAAKRVTAAALPDSDECTIVQQLHELIEVTVPVLGFGSSDCASCPSHLVHWPNPARLGKLQHLLERYPSA